MENKPPQTVFVTARVLAKTEFIEEVRTACVTLVAPSRSEPGCLSYNLYQSADIPGIFIFFEEWLTAVDLEKHLQTEAAEKFDRMTDGLLLEEEEIIYLEKIK
jgi:quinol monooxygenase YgiN